MNSLFKSFPITFYIFSISLFGRLHLFFLEEFCWFCQWSLLYVAQLVKAYQTEKCSCLYYVKLSLTSWKVVYMVNIKSSHHNSNMKKIYICWVVIIKILPNLVLKLQSAILFSDTSCIVSHFYRKPKRECLV